MKNIADLADLAVGLVPNYAVIEEKVPHCRHQLSRH